MKSSALFKLSEQYFPGGVNSPVRAFRGVGNTPLFIDSAHGAYLKDADGKEYIDYVGSWGPMIVGHAHPEVVKAVTDALKKGFSFGAPTEVELLLAQKITALVPSIEMMRFVSSGTEATMSAIRLARGATQRQKIVKFTGCYHGHSDSLLVETGSGGLTFGVPSSAGVPESFASHTLVAEYNRLDQVKSLFEMHGDDIAAIIVEPVAGNMNCVLPIPGFLQGLRDLCDQYKSVLIFDEVMTGFRVALGGAQSYYNITPDLTTLGKIIGGGFPVGAYGGRKSIMQHISPLGKVYQAGTLSGNPIAMTAGLATLHLISQPGVYEKLSAQTNKLMDGLKKVAASKNIPLLTHAISGMFGFMFTDQKNITSEKEVSQSNVNLFKQFFHAMLSEGVYFAPSAFEAGFVSTMHGDQEIQKTIDAAERALHSI